MVDPVECRGQVGVHDPHARGTLATQRLEDGGNGIMAAAARPEPVAAGFEPDLPFGLQGVADPCLVTPIHEHRDGCFILLLLQSRVGMFGSVVELC